MCHNVGTHLAEPKKNLSLPSWTVSDLLRECFLASWLRGCCLPARSRPCDVRRCEDTESSRASTGVDSRSCPFEGAGPAQWQCVLASGQRVGSDESIARGMEQRCGVGLGAVGWWGSDRRGWSGYGRCAPHQLSTARGSMGHRLAEGAPLRRRTVSPRARRLQRRHALDVAV
jgi:hypothetical protein